MHMTRAAHLIILYLINLTRLGDPCKSLFSRYPQRLLSALDALKRRYTYVSPRMTNCTIVETNY
jgi:hypothetical protein